jgi:hypothetical protein
MIGAAVAAPMMPALGSAGGISGTTYDLAILHAKKFPLVSVGGLSKRIGIGKSQAEAIIEKMSSDGLLGALNPTRPGTVKASSKIFVNPNAGLARAYERRQAKTSKAKQDQRVNGETSPQVSAMFAHLHQLSTACGMTLSPRCFSGVHA